MKQKRGERGGEEGDERPPLRGEMVLLKLGCDQDAIGMEAAEKESEGTAFLRFFSEKKTGKVLLLPLLLLLLLSGNLRN